MNKRFSRIHQTSFNNVAILEAPSAPYHEIQDLDVMVECLFLPWWQQIWVMVLPFSDLYIVVTSRLARTSDDHSK